MSTSQSEPLPKGLVEALGRPAAYPHDPSAAGGVSTVQTHISHLFLTADHVCKLRKAVALGFLDFGTRHIRNRDCLAELRLNRRLAADVYLGVAPVQIRGRDVFVGEVGESTAQPDLEHCVVMRRLPDGRDGVSLIDRGEFGPQQIDAVALAIVRFHEQHRLGRPAPFSPETWLDRVSKPVEDNFTPISGVIDVDDDDRLSRLARGTRDFFERHRDEFERRRVDGRVVDGHGDLHLAHVWFETGDSEPLFVDCIEFSDQLRQIDAASEAAFLAMDLTYRGHPDLADRFLRRYAAHSDDFHLYSILDYYLSYRAAVRAKVAAIAAVEVEIPDSQRRAARASAGRHLDLASAAMFRSKNGAVVAMAGVVGTGKSSAAQEVADSLGGVVISSDPIRKRLAGLDPLDRGDAALDSGMYADEVTQRVYRGLLERARSVVHSGRVAVLDATFSRSEQRARAAAFASEHDVPFLILETRCNEALVLKRLEERARRALDPSDAGPGFYPESVKRFAPVRREADYEHIVVDTAALSWRDDLHTRVGTWRRRSTRDGVS